MKAPVIRMRIGTVLQHAGLDDPPPVEVDPSRTLVRVEAAPDEDRFSRSLFDIRVALDANGVPRLEITSSDAVMVNGMLHGGQLLVQPGASNSIAVLLVPRKL